MKINNVFKIKNKDSVLIILNKYQQDTYSKFIRGNKVEVLKVNVYYGGRYCDQCNISCKTTKTILGADYELCSYINHSEVLPNGKRVSRVYSTKGLGSSLFYISLLKRSIILNS